MSAKTVISDFYKKNKTLVTFLILTLIAAVVLIIMCVSTCDHINTAIVEIKEKGARVEAINSKGKAKDRTNPKIVKGNAARIKKDASDLADKTRELQRVCGQGHDAFFIAAFCGEDMPENMRSFGAYLKAFATVTAKGEFKIADYIKSPSYSQLGKIFNAVRDEVAKNDEAKAQFDKAFAKFADALAKSTAENLKQFESSAESAQDLPAKAVFLQVLGLPRTIHSDNYLAYRNHLWDSFVRAYAADGSRAVSASELERMMKNKRDGEDKDRGVMGQQSESKPVQENIVHLCKLFQIYEQVLQKVKEVSTESTDKGDFMLLQCAPPKNIEFGYKDLGNGYHAYQLEVTVRGTLADVRAFVNKLHLAYKQNHVFAMYNFSLKSYVPEKKGKQDVVADLNTEIFRHVFAYSTLLNNILVGEVTSEANAENAEGRQEGVVQEEAAAKKILKPYSMKDDKHYGAMLLGFGHDKWVVANLTFDYIIFNPAISNVKDKKK